MLEGEFRVPAGEDREELMLSEQEAKSHIARIAYRQGYEEGARVERENAESLIKRTELSVRAASTRFAADVLGIFVAIPGGALMWAVGGEMAGLATFVVAGLASVILLTKSQGLRRQTVML